MAEILNISALHNEGAAKATFGIRGNSFQLKKDIIGDNSVISLLNPATEQILPLKADVILPDGTVLKDKINTIEGSISSLQSSGGGSSSGQTYTVDDSLSSTSTNPVQNKIINEALNSKADSTHDHNSLYPTIADAYNASNMNSGTLSTDRLPTIPLTKGGTGATSAADARTALDVYDKATVNNMIANVSSGSAGGVPRVEEEVQQLLHLIA